MQKQTLAEFTKDITDTAEAIKPLMVPVSGDSALHFAIKIKEMHLQSCAEPYASCTQSSVEK
jgi:hypothetical protein